MPSWPASLPQRPSYPGYGEAPQSQVLKSDMDAGPPKRRRRFTAGTRTLSVQYDLTEQQVEDFKSFFYGELAAGALPFEWTDPRTGEPVSAIAGDGSPPYQIQPLSGGDWWRLSISIEVQP